MRGHRFVINCAAGAKASGEFNVYLREVWLDHGLGTPDEFNAPCRWARRSTACNEALQLIPATVCLESTVNDLLALVRQTASNEGPRPRTNNSVPYIRHDEPKSTQQQPVASAPLRWPFESYNGHYFWFVLHIIGKEIRSPKRQFASLHATALEERRRPHPVGRNPGGGYTGPTDAATFSNTSRRRGAAKSRKRRILSGICPRETWTRFTGTGFGSNASRMMRSASASTASAT